MASGKLPLLEILDIPVGFVHASEHLLARPVYSQLILLYSIWDLVSSGVFAVSRPKYTKDFEALPSLDTDQKGLDTFVARAITVGRSRRLHGSSDSPLGILQDRPSQITSHGPRKST